NRLTLAEAGQAVAGQQASFHGRERDVTEVRNYWNALIRMEEWAEKGTPLTDHLIRRLHALVEKGKRAKPTPYRDGQNAIRDATTGAIVYMPPEASDVPALMSAMIRWAKAAEGDGIPVPIIAGLVHYQFVTIHPFYDGNGRTARLLATFILHRGGYGLNGFLSLEEHHARDIERYYAALVTHPHHNYYEGRGDADLTAWVQYFIATLAGVFDTVRNEADRATAESDSGPEEALLNFDHRARTVLGLFGDRESIVTRDVARLLGLSDRTARELLVGWVADGWLEVANPSNRARSYRLSAVCRRFVGGLSAETGD
ncbi:MAG TPA: Fic family protein, partial [Armatimonadota bacterium]|nr:Fic family protein [Armatimonadota bacterium]